MNVLLAIDWSAVAVRPDSLFYLFPYWLCCTSWAISAGQMVWLPGRKVLPVLQSLVFLVQEKNR